MSVRAEPLDDVETKQLEALANEMNEAHLPLRLFNDARAESVGLRDMHGVCLADLMTVPRESGFGPFDRYLVKAANALPRLFRMLRDASSRGTLARAFSLSDEAVEQLGALRERSGHADGAATIEWLIRSQVDHYNRIDRLNAADAKERKAKAAARARSATAVEHKPTRKARA